MKKDGSILISIIVILSSLLIMGIATSSAVLSTTIKTQRSYQEIQALDLAEAGVNVAIRELNNGVNYTGTNGIPDGSLSTGEFEVEVLQDCGLNCQRITAVGYVPQKANYKTKKAVRVKLTDQPSSTGLAFAYGVQAGPLGITMSNNSEIRGENGALGNVYAQGTIQGGNHSIVTGDVIMAGPTGRINSIEVGGNAKAHTINQSVIGRDAFYQIIDSFSANNTLGTKYPNSPDPAIVDLPVTQQMINEWENAAAVGGTYEGNLIISATTTNLGPKKINGDLTITNGAIVTMKGTLWVTGNITISNNAVVVLDPDYGDNSGLIVADNPNNPSAYGKIIVNNNAKICGSISVTDCQNGLDPLTNKSYMMLLSTNSSTTIANPAINVSNNSSAVIYYSTVGMLEVGNNARLRAFTGGGLHLSNGAIVEYRTGLASADFANGPGGSWTISDWQIIY